MIFVMLLICPDFLPVLLCMSFLNGLGFFTLNVGFSIYLVNGQKFTIAFNRIWKRGMQKNGIVFGVI